MKLAAASLLLSLSMLHASGPSADLVKIYKKAFHTFKANPKSHKAIMKLALASFDAGYFKQAYDLVLQFLELKPDNAQALVLYSNILIEYGHEEKARRKLARIIDLYPGSQEAEKAQNSIEMLDRLHNPFQKKFSFNINGGLDSNPAYLIENDYLSDFMTTIGCQNSTQNCDYLNRFSDANPYAEMRAKTHYIYDAGDTGSFFLTYGWSLASKMYFENIDAGYINAQLAYGLGLSAGSSSYHLPFFIKETFTKYKNFTDGSRIDYSTFKIRPHYRYRFQDRSLFSIGIEHEEQDSPSSFTYTYNSSTNYIDYSQNKTFGFIQYQSKLFNTHPYTVMLYRGDQSDWDNNGDYNNSYYSMPYSEYNFSGLNLMFNYKSSPEKEYKTTLNFRRKWYTDHYIPGTYPIAPDECRKDYSIMFDFQSVTINQKLSKTILGYKFYANDTNYQPLDFNKHELYLAYYWLP